MPVLRIGEESNVGGTLGGLGQALSNALNPRTRAEALMLQQRMMLEQLNYQQELRKIQAQQQAMQQWSSIVPPESMPQIRSMILQNAPYEQIARYAAGAMGPFRPSGTPENDAFNAKKYEFATGKPWTEVYGMPVDEISRRAATQEQARAAGEKLGAETTARLSAEDARRAGLQGQYVQHPTTPDDYAANLRIYRQLNPDKADPPGGIVVTDEKTQKQSTDFVNTQKQAEAEATARGTALGGGIEAGRTFRYPESLPALPPAASPWTGETPQTPAPGAPAPPAPPTAPPAAPKGPAQAEMTTAPSTVAPGYMPPRTVQTVIPGVGVQIGEDPEEAKTRAGITEKRGTILQGAYDAGSAAYQLKSKLNEAQMLVNFINPEGVSGQAIAAANRYAAEHGITVGDKAKARAALDQIYKSELPELLKSSGVQRTAGPEIGFFRPILGNPDMPASVANDIIARQQAIADMQIQRHLDAASVLGIAGEPMQYAGPGGFAEREMQRNQAFDQAVQDIMSRQDTILGKAKAQTEAAAAPFKKPPTALTQTPSAQAPAATTPTPAPAPIRPAEPAPAQAPVLKAETPPAPPEFPGAGIWGLIGQLFGQSAGGPPATAAPPLTPAEPAPTPLTVPPPQAPAPRVFQMGPGGRILMPPGETR